GTRRNATDTTPIAKNPPSRNTRRPNRSSNAPTTNTLASPERPPVPMMKPTSRSEPPRARMCSGSRKNDANARKKKKLATVTRTNAGDSIRPADAIPPGDPLQSCGSGRRVVEAARMATERQRELRRRRKRRRERLKVREREQARERRRQRAQRAKVGS